ncbi:WbbJ Acetyltransferase (isoleucine patch superfamily) [Candidatus Nanopelagicaceae bacterium]
MPIVAINERNDSTANEKKLLDGTLTLCPLAEIRNSFLSGHNVVGMYSTINRSTFGSFSNIGVSSYISDSIVDRFTLIGSRVSIGGFNHPLSYLSIGAFQWGQSLEEWGYSEDFSKNFESGLRPTKIQTEIGSDCWIGDNSVVLAGTKLGHGCVVGAGSVVTKDVPPYAIVVGNPARVIRFRFSEDLILRLLETRWWESDIEELVGLDFANPANFSPKEKL